MNWTWKLNGNEPHPVPLSYYLAFWEMSCKTEHRRCSKQASTSTTRVPSKTDKQLVLFDCSCTNILSSSRQTASQTFFSHCTGHPQQSDPNLTQAGLTANQSTVTAWPLKYSKLHQRPVCVFQCFGQQKGVPDLLRCCSLAISWVCCLVEEPYLAFTGSATWTLSFGPRPLLRTTPCRFSIAQAAVDALENFTNATAIARTQRVSLAAHKKRARCKPVLAGSTRSKPPKRTRTRTGRRVPSCPPKNASKAPTA